MHVALLANLKKNAPTWPGMSPDCWDELDSEETIESISAAIASRGHRVTFLEGDATLLDTLRQVKPDICFNICEGHFGDGREAQVPAILEKLRIPYTGSRVLAMALALDKPMTKRVLAYHGLPTPPFQTFERVNEALEPGMQFPLFVKPAREGTGMGVSAESIVYDEARLRIQLQRIFDRYGQAALVERYIEGREITVGLIGNFVGPVARRLPDDDGRTRMFTGLDLLPPLEVDMSRYSAEEAGLYTHRMKTEWFRDFHYHCPAPLDPAMVDLLHWYAAATFRVIGCLDVARIDFRLDASNDNQPYILEINPLPGLYPGYSDLCIEARAHGWTYEELIHRILNAATKRYGLNE